MNPISHVHRQNGAALVVGLILLLIITVFAVSGMSTATLELVLAGNTQYKEDAFQAAESAIEVEFRQGQATPGTPRNNTYTFEGSSKAATQVTYRTTTLAPDGYSLTEYSSDHYTIRATGTSAKNSQSINEQGFYVVIPGT